MIKKLIKLIPGLSFVIWVVIKTGSSLTIDQQTVRCPLARILKEVTWYMVSVYQVPLNTVLGVFR